MLAAAASMRFPERERCDPGTLRRSSRQYPAQGPFDAARHQRDLPAIPRSIGGDASGVPAGTAGRTVSADTITPLRAVS